MNSKWSYLLLFNKALSNNVIKCILYRWMTAGSVKIRKIDHLLYWNQKSDVENWLLKLNQKKMAF